MFHAPRHPGPSTSGDLSQLLDRLAHCSTRPRYAFMALTLIADAARADGTAGPMVANGERLIPLRDWLSDALTPMGHRDPRRQALMDRVRDDLRSEGRLPDHEADAATMIEEEVRARARAAGKSNLSRAVSELVRAGLVRRHYQGYRVDHHNRGAQRQAVYTLIGDARVLLGKAEPQPTPARRPKKPEQLTLF
ncbi:hypothetical protein [Sphingobium bisphenolivorans]|uniref:hypothetical protein n=1 Tax=Sphingobium bisphenolivorans TaxID=1335760 RepID=UPI0003A675C3|nr:hypothetical protein [Sphingobium bisphenolivorans]